MESFNSSEEQLKPLEVLAQNAITKFGLPKDSSIKLINYSENITYKVENSDSGEIFTLRVHRPDYHTLNAIESELTWMLALSNETDVLTSIPIIGTDGTMVQTGSAEGLKTDRYCVMFHWIDGQFPNEDNLSSSFILLGAITARMHAHSRSWNLPRKFSRHSWDLENIFGDNPVWGHWQNAIGLSNDGYAILSRLETTLKNKLNLFENTGDRTGLVHADLRLDNILMNNNGPNVIDFDDCGFSWYLYDFATAVSFIEDRKDMDELITSWVEGYRTIQPLSIEEEKALPTFILLRRLLLTAWVASHYDTSLAQSLGEDYTNGSCTLAEDYLVKYG